MCQKAYAPIMADERERDLDLVPETIAAAGDAVRAGEFLRARERIAGSMRAADDEQQKQLRGFARCLRVDPVAAVVAAICLVGIALIAALTLFHLS
ncbi:MAG: hypothetical protein JXR96_24945 [Deltaproteobacteria bacterium]|nr:hypothetical protein [Deltaproteobacteria bacterium]